MFNQAQHSIINEFQTLSTTDQIKYLQEENIFLKSLINDAQQPQSNQKKRRQQHTCNDSSPKCKCHDFYMNLLNKYEKFLDNLTRQLLNSLQMQDAIRYELSHIERVKSQTRATTCKSCKTTSTKQQQLNEITNVGYSDKYFDESINSIYRFQLLLNQQQDQQLKMFNDVCAVSKLLRVQKSELVKPVASSFFQSKNLFKSASSYISFITEQYEVAERKSLSLSQIASLKLSANENDTNEIYSNLHVLLNNHVSQMDLIKFDNSNQDDNSIENKAFSDDYVKKKSIDRLLNELNELKEIVYKESGQEINASSENKAQCKFNDTILKEINYKYERPVVLNITGHTVKIEQNLAASGQEPSLPIEVETSMIQPKVIPLFENKQKSVSICNNNRTVPNKTKTSSKSHLTQSKIPKLNKSLNDSVNTSSSSSLPPSQPGTDRSQSKSHIPQLRKPKVLKPTVFSQPFKPPPTPVRRPKNQRISIVKPVKKTPNYQQQHQHLVNSSTFEKKNQPETETTYDKPCFNPMKRCCFPTLQSASIYYNNQFFTQFNEYLNTSKKTSFKYLSDSDINSLANRLSLDEKDPFYNVYHLDTLYNNIDYILFNSYASDTELAYDLNRQHNERTKKLIRSNYKLFIHDYFNKTYHEESEEVGVNDEGDVIIEESEEEEEVVEMNVSEELIELEFDEYDIQEDSLMLHTNNEYGMEVDEFVDYKLDSPGVELEILKFESESLLSSPSKNCFYTDSSTFNDVYLQITDDDNKTQSNLEKMYFDSVNEQKATAPMLISVSSLSSLLTGSKSFNGGDLKFNTYEQNENSSLLNSSIDSSGSSSGLTLFSNLTTENSHKSRNEQASSSQHREEDNDYDECIFKDDWAQNLDLNEFTRNINVNEKFFNKNFFLLVF